MRASSGFPGEQKGRGILSTRVISTRSQTHALYWLTDARSQYEGR